MVCEETYKLISLKKCLFHLRDFFSEKKCVKRNSTPYVDHSITNEFDYICLKTLFRITNYQFLSAWTCKITAIEKTNVLYDTPILII